MTLLVRLRLDGSVEWRSNEGLNGSGEVEVLTELAYGQRVVVAVPSEEVLLHQLHIPKGRRQFTPHLATFALEDELACDIDQIHCALGTVNGEWQDAATIPYQSMQYWLSLMPKLNVSQVIPDILLLPWQPERYTAWREKDRVVVRSGPFSGSVCHIDTLSLWLEHAISSHPQDHVESLLWLGDPPPGLPLPLQVYQGDLALQWLTQAEQETFNLLQGRYRPMHRSISQRHWRAFAAAATVLILLAIYGKERWQLHQLDHEIQQLNQKAEQILRQSAPQIQRIVNPRAQLAALVAEQAENQTAGQEIFVQALLPLVDAFEQLKLADAVRIQGLRLNGNQLEVNMESGSADAFSQLEKWLLEQQPNVQIQLSTRQNQQLTQAELRLNLKGS